MQQLSIYERCKVHLIFLVLQARTLSQLQNDDHISRLASLSTRRAAFVCLFVSTDSISMICWEEELPAAASPQKPKKTSRKNATCVS
jgi:hypothetical protein